MTRLRPWLRDVAAGGIVAVATSLIAALCLDLLHRDISVPWRPDPFDATWQFSLTKVMLQTGWVNTNPFLGAPAVAHWHFNPAAQSSPLHSVLMYGLKVFSTDAVTVQQLYYLLNFPLIGLLTYLSARVLGIGRTGACAVGILFALTAYRFNFGLYAFLGNYFSIGPAVATVTLVLMGRFRQEPSGGLRSWIFVFGLVASALVAVSDGYYAYFTALLLAFAFIVRLAAGDWRKWVALVAPAIFGMVVVAIQLGLSVPLLLYKRGHAEEFSPGGVPDPSLARLPMEAEVYSSNLKLLFAPLTNHHIGFMGAIGQAIIDTLNASRAFPTGQIMTLGILGGALFLVAVGTLFLPRRPAVQAPMIDLRQSLGSMSVFIFGCLTTGGIGPLIAMVYPQIRAYDRISMFLLLVVYLVGAAMLTAFLKKGSRLRRAMTVVVVAAVVAAAIYDQVPSNSAGYDKAEEAVFRAERAAVRRIEASLPRDAMVYQYPHSQYMEVSPYYGWGSQMQIRLYLHSDRLRWSNGGSRNSPVENWHIRTRSFPIDTLVKEVASAGFSEIVVDRRVVGDEEFEKIASVAGLKFDVDVDAKLAYAALPAPNVSVVYDDEMRITRIRITKPEAISTSYIPVDVKKKTLLDFISRRSKTESGSIDVSVRRHPELILTDREREGQSGARALEASEVSGALQCKKQPDGSVDLILKNAGEMTWATGTGRLPMEIGRHKLSADGTVVEFDDGWRADFPKGSLAALDEIALHVRPSDLAGSVPGVSAARFELLQEGVMWHSQVQCTVSLD